MQTRSKGRYRLDICSSIFSKPAGLPGGARERRRFPLRSRFFLPLRFCGGLVALSNAASAAVASEAAAPVGAGSVFQMLLGLVVVLGLVFAAAWAMRRFSPHAVGGGNTVRIVAGTAVGQRERVLLLEVNETWLVVGVAPGRVSPLHTMPKPANVEIAGTQPAVAGGFAAWLKQTMERRNG